MTDTIQIRMATLDDVPTIVHQRHAMFTDMDRGTPETRARMNVEYAPWLANTLTTGEYVGWLAVTSDGTAVAGVGVRTELWPVGATDQTGKRAYVDNVYTDPAWRGRGLAKQLLRTALDWAREHGFETARLNASDAGRPLYEALGFQPSNEMMLRLV